MYLVFESIVDFYLKSVNEQSFAADAYQKELFLICKYIFMSLVYNSKETILCSEKVKTYRMHDKNLFTIEGIAQGKKS